jgi:hypothetical protein
MNQTVDRTKKPRIQRTTASTIQNPIHDSHHHRHTETTRASGTHMRPTARRTQSNIIQARLPKQSVRPDARTAIEAAAIKRSTWNVVHLQVVDSHYRLAG